MSKSPNSIDELCVNTIRTLSLDAVQTAGSGHPGLPMGMADAAYVLWTKFMNHDPAHPNWHDRDRFVLSAGHGSMLLYSLLHLTGYDLSLEELKNFRQLGSITPGHPEYGLTPGVETTTGPLGQGFGTGVGMAIAEANLAARYNKDDISLTDHCTYGIVSDGDLMEGISHEAASMAGHMKLGKIIYLYDDNSISIDGSTDLAFTEDVQKRFEAYEWHTQKIDGHNRDEVEQAITKAQKVTDKPSLIICKTKIGFGSPHNEGTANAHSDPMEEEEVRLTKKNLGMDPDKKFEIPDGVLEHYRKAKKEGSKKYKNWQQKHDKYIDEYEEAGEEFDNAVNRVLPENWEEFLPSYEAGDDMSSRDSSGKALQKLAANIPQLIGGSADLTGSNRTELKDDENFTPENNAGRYFHFGVREHAMVAALNGMAMHGGVIPFGGTFFVFTDYCRPAIRIAALSEVDPILVLSHDSIGLGEDGPTHQSIEQLASLRAMPNALVLRPADANEVSWCWKLALQHTDGPSLLVLSRQSIPTFGRDDNNAAKNAEKGAYILADSEQQTPDVILMGTGSEVQYAMDAREKLASKDVDARVVSMPSWELFRQQSQSYRDSVFPPEVTARVSIEAASPLGWREWVGQDGTVIGLERFGISAPYKQIYEELGITADHVVEEALKLVQG